MKLNDFPADIQPHLLPSHAGRMVYRCLGCGGQFGIERLLNVCPECWQILLIEDLDFARLKATPGRIWRRIFDYRKMLTLTALKGIYRYHEFIGPVIPLEAVVYLGEGHTPLVAANGPLRDKVGADFFFKNDGQNPSASLRARPSAFSYIHAMVLWGPVLRFWPSAPPPATHVRLCRPYGRIWHRTSSPPYCCPRKSRPAAGAAPGQWCDGL